MKKLLIILFTLVLVGSPAFYSYALPADSVLVNIDSVTVAKTIETSKDSIRTISLQDRISELGAPPVDKVITTAKIVWSLIIILIGFLILKIIDILLNRIGRKSVQYRILIKRIIPIVKIIGWTFVIYIIIQGVIRPPLATVIAFFTSVGVAVGFAAQGFVEKHFWWPNDTIRQAISNWR